MNTEVIAWVIIAIVWATCLFTLGWATGVRYTKRRLTTTMPTTTMPGAAEPGAAEPNCWGSYVWGNYRAAIDETGLDAHREPEPTYKFGETTYKVSESEGYAAWKAKLSVEQALREAWLAQESAGGIGGAQ